MFPIVLYPNSTKEMEELCLLVLVPTTEILVLWKHCTWPQIEHNALFNDTDAEIAFNPLIACFGSSGKLNCTISVSTLIHLWRSFSTVWIIYVHIFIDTFVWYILLWLILLFWSLLLNWCFFAFGFISFSRVEVIIC